MSIIADRYEKERKYGFPSSCGALFAPAKDGEVSKIIGRYVIYKVRYRLHEQGTIFECSDEGGCDFEYKVRDTDLCNVEVNGQRLVEHHRKVHS